MRHLYRRITVALAIGLAFQTTIQAQGSAGVRKDEKDLIDSVLAKKDLPDSILGKRTLLLPGDFDAQDALRKLFPGKWYDLSTKDYSNKLISWSCSTCIRITYPDVNGEEEPMGFPYEEGVATRLIKVLDYADSKGQQYKLLSFNHSVYDQDGLQTGRFSGGLLGFAKFNRTDSGWRLQAFQPGIGAYGSFAQAPAPKPVLIGEDQYAFMIEHVNGGGGGPFDQADFLLAGAGGAYKQILAAYNVGRTEGEEQQCHWTCTYQVIPAGKKYFQDILFICQGQYWASDKDGLPDELKGKLGTSKKGRFTITRRFSFSGKLGYVEQLPAKVVVN